MGVALVTVCVVGICQKEIDMTMDLSKLSKDEKILYFAGLGQFDGSHHKTWVIDQIVRVVMDCPIIEKTTTLTNGQTFTFQAQGESQEYKDFVSDYCGEEGEYRWNIGIAP